MSKARGLAALGNAYNDGALSNRNLIINGAMQVAQRGTSAVTPTSGGSLYPVDRWGAYAAPSSKYSAQQQTGGPAGFDNYVRITSLSAHTSSSSDFFPFFTNLEGQDVQQLQYGSSDAKDVTISFWVRSSLTGNFSISFRAAVSSTSYITTYTINAANTWEYKTITIAGNTSTSIANNNLLGFDVNFDLGHGSSNESTANTWIAGSQNRVAGTVRLVETNGATLDITGVQLEVGDTATPFEHRSYGDELQRCQRYFHEHAVEYFLYTIRSDDDSRRVTCSFPVTMRATPSISLTSFILDGASSIITQGVTAGGVRWKSLGHASGDAPVISVFTADAEL
jgi:hypothetical protein